MRRMAGRAFMVCGLFLPLVTAGATPLGGAAAESAARAWTVSLSAGAINFEGDEPVEDAFIGSASVGRDVSECWTVEAVLEVTPELDESLRRDWRTLETVSRLEERAGTGVRDTASLRLSLDALYHLSRWDRIDPYAAFGVGVVRYADDFGDQTEPCLRLGGGIMYHLTESWSLRADARWLTAGADTEENLVLTAGLTWNTVPEGKETPVVSAPAPMVSAVTEDAAARDTDGDGLSDAAEVKAGTNPAEADTDYDGLKDGEEVQVYRTNPRMRDTDGGGVADGHEVIEDRTQPLSKGDDLDVYELQMTFDDADSEIKAEYLADLNAIAQVLKTDGGAKARIEGHIDQAAASNAKADLRRTERRARAVLDYLAGKGAVEKQRLTAVGYGFSRPKAANDPARGNPDNRRMEIYVRRTQPAKP